MKLSIIVAAAENSVIGKDNNLIWHLPADLKYFKTVTTGHSVIMGRKTYLSIGRPLPNRRNIIISTDKNLSVENCEVAHSVEEAMELVKNEDEAFVIGGGSVYKTFWDKADRIYLTLVHTVSDGDTKIPAISPLLWKEVSREHHLKDNKNAFDYSFVVFERK
ncbi:MAG: dihydrofolate reductase [Culturomica sp.]|jgi:dihydrofolate reductase|nr:dihydrofolate reductase [Culturomica sp.]